MGALRTGLPSPAMVLETWPIVVIDIKDCFFNIYLHPNDTRMFAFTISSVNAAEPSKRVRSKMSTILLHKNPSRKSPHWMGVIGGRGLMLRSFIPGRRGFFVFGLILTLINIVVLTQPYPNEQLDQKDSPSGVVVRSAPPIPTWVNDSHDFCTGSPPPLAMWNSVADHATAAVEHKPLVDIPASNSVIADFVFQQLQPSASGVWATG
ncbi:hypothetical protein WISP_61218 [Willisornis vidua]|uniref:Uncharacterized protein n=1 Tax=Willisornis vidua TaxID=1566151 RepID=A0ABQ9DB62_9PASS|nr:hypothetical protein WISP_61218 [Willisornis vidua]